MSNIMFLSDLHPDEVYRWFMEMTVDGYDWVVVPNVYGLSQYSSGFDDSLPFLCSSNYILKMSHYKKDEWCDIWDGLYYRFVEKTSERFAKNPQIKKATQQMNKLTENHRRVISYRAEDFLRDRTNL